jgi:hypothetical protein
MGGAILTLPQYVFMVWCFVKHRDNFTFTKVKQWQLWIRISVQTVSREKFRKEKLKVNAERPCKESEETVDPVTSGWHILAKNEYKMRHEKVCTHLHYSISKTLGIGTAENWYSHICEHEDITVLWNEGYFSLHHRVQNGSGAHPASYPMGTRGSFPGGKAAGA